MTYACTVTKNGLMGACTTLKVLQAVVPWTGDSLKQGLGSIFLKILHKENKDQTFDMIV